MKLTTSLISTFLTFGSSFKLSTGPSAVRSPLSNMPYTRRTACPTVPLRRGLPIPGFEDRTWDLPEIFRKRMNRKIGNFEIGQCDTMLVRIENDHVIDVCFHYEWEVGNPWTMETTCVSERYREIDCYMGNSPFAPMPKSCEAKEDMPIFLSPSLMNTGLGALLYDFDPTESSSESFGPESYGPESDSYGLESESYGPDSYDQFAEAFQPISEPEQYYYVDSNGNLKISDCKPTSPGCILDDSSMISSDDSSDNASSGLRRRKRGIQTGVPKMIRTKTHQKRHS